MSDTAILDVPAIMHTPLGVGAHSRAEQRWVRELYSSLTEVESRLDELSAGGYMCQLIILGNELFAVEWL